MKTTPSFRPVLLGLAVLLFAITAGAQPTTMRFLGADSLAYSRVATNTWLVRPANLPLKLYDITITSVVSSGDYYLMVFDQTSAPVAGDYPVYTSVKVTAGNDRSYFFTGGLAISNGLWLAASDTPITFTNTLASPAKPFTIGCAYEKNLPR